MKMIKLMPDYFCYPLWGVNPDELGDISPNDLPLSDSLREALLAWAHEYDQTIDMNDPSSAGFDSQESANKFVATGHQLRVRLKEELGPDYQITHFFNVGPKVSTKGNSLRSGWQ